MGEVIHMVRDPAEAWQAYCDLIAEQSADASLLRNVEHQLKIVRAWRRWAALVPNEEAQPG